MAQLTLSQRSLMANNGHFLQRLGSALHKTANYWKTSPAEVNNTANYKRKTFSAQILAGQLPNMQAYADYLLGLYNETAPTLIDLPGDTSDKQVTDDVLTDSFASAAAFDYFAGIKTEEV